MNSEFPYTPPELEVLKQTKITDFSKQAEPVVQLTGFEKQTRPVYKYVCEFAYHARVDDYINMPKYSGLITSYRAYLLKEAERKMTKDEFEMYREDLARKGKEELQVMIAEEVHDVAVELAKKYEYLQHKIDDEFELEEEDDFNYQGSTEFWVYASKNTLNRGLKPQHNELSRWLYILVQMSDSELRRLNNPFIIEIFMKRMFIHPVLGLPFDITLNDSKQTYGNKRVVNLLRKRFKTSIENQNAARREGKCLQEETALYKMSAGYIDGEELQVGINMYVFALRFNNVMRKYPKPATSHQCSIFLGYQARSSISATATMYTKFIDEYNLRLSTPLDQMEPYERTILERKVAHFTRYQQARRMLTDLQSMPAESILLNPNAKNVAGPMFILKSLENGQWNEVKEEVEERKLVVEFSNPKDLGLKP